MNSKESNIQVRTSKEEADLAKRLAKDYGVSVSELVRLALLHIDEQRPIFTVTLVPMGKAHAPMLEMSLN